LGAKTRVTAVASGAASKRERARKKIFGYMYVCFATLGIAFFGFLVRGHHMFVAGESVYAAMTFSILSHLVAVHSAVKVFNWTATLYKGSISYATPMLYALGFIGLFTIGGLTGYFSRRSASTYTSTTPTSSSRTSTTSWSAAW
jgi:heme/copper-type cytochrome/quinol oxidase subunit 1